MRVVETFMTFNVGVHDVE